MMRLVNEAKKVLYDAESRKAYDAKRHPARFSSLLDNGHVLERGVAMTVLRQPANDDSRSESPADSQATTDAIPLTPVPRLLLRPAEAALALGISSRLLWSLTRDGTIPAIRLRRAVRYSPQALQSFIDNAK